VPRSALRRAAIPPQWMFSRLSDPNRCG